MLLLFANNCQVFSSPGLYGPGRKKTWLGGLRTTMAQTDQRLCYSIFGKYHI